MKKYTVCKELNRGAIKIFRFLVEEHKKRGQLSNWGNQRKMKLRHRGKEVLIDKVFDYENIEKPKDAIVLIADYLKL